MNEMNIDNMDNIIKQAAEKIAQPEFDMQAWDKMDQMLDKEFNKKKRRFIFWWWLLPVIVAGSATSYYFYFTNQSQTKPTNIEVLEIPTGSKKTDSLFENNITDNKKTIETAQNKTEVPAVVKQHQIRLSSLGNPVAIAGSSAYKKNNRTQLNLSPNNFQQKNNAIDVENKKEVVDKAEPPSPIHATAVITAAQNGQQQNSTEKTTAIHHADSSTKATMQQSEAANNTETKATPTLSKSESLSRFFISGGAAIDASFIHINTIEQAKIISGIGFGYRINKRLIIQTGFYAGSKIYTSHKEDYNFKNYNFPYVNTIQYINADCYVFDVPLTMRYNLTVKKNNNWYTTVGLSSLFMKNESYDVYYNYGPNTPTHEVNWTYSNKNNHPFSVLNISVGFESALKKNVFISAEPYYKLPLGGVGEGAVQLSSIGLQLGIRYNFLKKNK